MFAGLLCTFLDVGFGCLVLVCSFSAAVLSVRRLLLCAYLSLGWLQLLSEVRPPELPFRFLQVFSVRKLSPFLQDVRLHPG